MIKKTLHFSNPAYLSLKNSQLLIDLPHLKVLGEKESKKTIPIEDIGMVMLDHQQITITHGCMAALMENNAVIITCNHTHHPIGMMLPIDGHDWIFRSIVRHDSDTKYASIPKQSTPRFRGKGYHLFRGKVHHFVRKQYL